MSDRHERHGTRRPDGRWQQKKQGTSRARAVGTTQGAAIERAREILENDGGGELVIHRLDRWIRDSDTIRLANDPFPPLDRA